MPAISRDLVILGAGPAGLAAAWRAARRGLSVIVLERAGRVGGLAGSFEVDGIRVDFGSHRLHNATPPDLLGELTDLLGEDLQLRRRNGRLRVGEHWVGFPLKPGELVRALPPRMVRGIARDAALSPLRRPKQDSYAGVLRASLGPTVYDALYGPYALKLWGLTGEEISAEQARRRVTADTPWKVAGRMLSTSGAVRRKGTSGAVRGIGGRSGGQDKGTFWYPRRGYGQIVEALADSAVAAGAELRLRCDVDTVAPAVGSVRVSAKDGTVVTARHAFSTLPLPVLARLTRPGPPLTAVEGAARLGFRSMVLVYVVHGGGRWGPYDAHYLPGPETPIARISEPANYRDSADDPFDRSVLCAEVPCSPGDDVWTASDEDLGRLVEHTLATADLPPVKSTGVVVQRLPYVYPVYERGYERALAGVDAWARELPSVTTFGRLGLFVHDNTHHAMVMARDAVAALGADGFDYAAWERALARFSTHVVED